jgi:hypothetical protein
MNVLLFNLKVLVISFPFLLFLVFSSLSLTGFKVYGTAKGKEALVLARQSGQALYLINSLISLVLLAAVYVLIAYRFGFLTCFIFFALSISLIGSIRKSMVRAVLRNGEEWVASWYKMMSLLSLAAATFFVILVYNQFFTS